MMTRYSFVGVLLLFVGIEVVKGQYLKPGFDKAEYIEMMKISARFGAPSYVASVPAPENYQSVYRSPVVGLDNTWDLWTHKSKPIAVLSIRGTTANEVSWLANFYAAMVPAKGELQLNKNETFKYELSANPQAAVHIGWLISTAILAKDILLKVDSCYQKGVKDVIIMGHSQGGAIAFLLTAYLYSLQKQQTIPADIRFKTYCSAGPKPGNLFFAYEYESLTQNGWAYNVVNTADWVPEVPISIQTLSDFNRTNPFINAKSIIKKQKFPKNLALKHAYNQLNKPTLKAQKNYQKYLGKMASSIVKKNISGFVSPTYYHSNHYVRTGNTIVLKADEEYFKLYPDSQEKVFVHHFHQPYLYLVEKLAISNETETTASFLEGMWELTYLNTSETLAGLYPDKKPSIVFDVKNNQISGYAGCNRFAGKLNTSGSKINFTAPLAMTKMFCPGQGESLFVETLQKVTSYGIVEGKWLTLFKDDIALMRFEKK
ncbi:lipase family protein [Runella zeae]|uniref:lipase family protein n=1 Tax=Runella zeae TaxID=94255 RepID=UPI00040DD95A|nr:META domain-containing protein [Runella zeae]